GKVVPVGAYANSVPDGGAVAYYLGGPAGETSSGADLYSVSRRNPQSGWETSAALPPEDLANGDYLGGVPLTMLPSADLSRFLFAAFGPFVKENSLSLGPGGGDENLGLYRTLGNSSEPEWLTRPAPEFQAKPEPGRIKFGLEGVYPVGGSPDLSTVYFTYFGTLVPADESRARHVEPLPWNETTTYSEGEIVEEGGKRYESIKGENSKEERNQGRRPSATLGEWWQVTT